ncbi:MAG: CinA family nicotinamide mononucleotide deamidase-related protein [Planctomycetes bacterium]|nr:CinA family nicotinamide mononucleotide deamidase-related protein [Planctomycetota bacterium]
MIVEVITTGTEIVRGKTVDINSNYIARKFTQLGFEVGFLSTYRDNMQELVNGIDTAIKRADIVVVSGGLGPTKDDLTRDAVSKSFGVGSIYHKDEYNRLLKHYRKNSAPSNLKRQCYFPENSTLVSNSAGMATGFMIHKSGKTLAALSGVPKEMKYMLENVLTIFHVYYGPNTNQTSLHFKIFGIPEEIIDSKFRHILGIIGSDYNYSISAKGMIVTVIIDIGTNINLAQRIQEKVFMTFGKDVFTADEDKTLEEVVGELILKQWKKISIAESCTGGYITHKLTNVPGISASLYESVVAYSNEAKVRYLNVAQNDLLAHGAVSRQVALAMAHGVRKASKSDIGISTTGIAGPVGGTKEKPVGLVYFGFSTSDEEFVEEHVFKGDRVDIKENASNFAINILRKHLLKV